jgi:hypothetical protein
MKYYRFIAGTVDISGTEEEELFEIKTVVCDSLSDKNKITNKSKAKIFLN